MPSDGAKISSLLFSIGRRMREADHAGARAKKLSLLHYATLHYVAEQKRPTMQDVARQLCITPPAATMLIEGLEKERVVRRAMDRKDRRVVRLSLTPKGKKFLERGTKARMKKLDRLFAVLTSAERRLLAAILRKVEDAAEAGVKNGPAGARARA